MTLTAPAPPRQSGAEKPVQRRKWPTLTLLVVLGLLSVAAAAGLGVFVSNGMNSVSSGLNQIGQRTAPEVNVYTDLSFALSDLDAQAATVLLVGADSSHVGERGDALARYAQRSTQAAEDLQQAAANAGDNALTSQGLQTAIDQLETYETLVGQAFLINEQGADPPGQPSQQALGRYRLANDAMQPLLTAIERLLIDDHYALDDSYTSIRDNALADTIGLVLLGIVVILILVVLQGVLWRRQRRVLNPAIAIATVLTLVFTVVAAGVLAGASDHLRVAKEQSLDAVINLAQARAVSHAARADESQYLVDALRAPDYKQSFTDRSQEAVGLINQAGQGAAATDTQNAYQAFQKDDQQLRTADLATAISFDTGAAGADFTRFDQDLVGLTSTNQRSFASAMQAGDNEVAGWTVLIPLLAGAAIIVLVAGGLWPRIAEYRR